MIAAGVSIALGYGFTVDDALISTRVAFHVRTLGLHSFNPQGPSTDCVTPLGWSYLLALFSRSGPWAGLTAARILGAASTLVSASLLARLLREGNSATLHAARGNRHRRLCTGIVALALATHLPVGAWASSGMETATVMLLCTAGTLGVARRRWSGPVFAGLAAAWRPELVPWAATLTVLSPVSVAGAPRNVSPDSAWTGQTPPDPPLATRRQTLVYLEPPPNSTVAKRLGRLGVVLMPALLVVAVRVAWFGSPFPLAVLAKPSDSAHGLTYVWGAMRFTSFPVLVASARACRTVPVAVRAAATALAVHFVVVWGVGGDWMSLFRLFVPVVPAGLWVGWQVLLQQPRWVLWVKGTLVFGVNLLLLAQLGPQVRGVVEARARLVAEMAPLLRDSRHVAALDVGWVGASTPVVITDLAGVTDPEVARLAGGHTSKRLPTNLLERRGVDTVIVLLAPGESSPRPGTPLSQMRLARFVESQLMRQYGADEFRTVTSVALAATNQRYVLLTRPATRLR